MTEEELKAIRERCEKATNGPWMYVIIDEEQYCITAPTYPICSTLLEEDAYFIASAKQDIPKLLGEIDQLKSQLKAMTDIAEKFQPGVSKMVEYGLKRAKDGWNVYIGLPDAEDK